MYNIYYSTTCIVPECIIKREYFQLIFRKANYNEIKNVTRPFKKLVLIANYDLDVSDILVGKILWSVIFTSL